MKTYEPDDELVSLYVRLRHETLPIHPPAAAVELPDGSHELVAPRDWCSYLDALSAPMTAAQPEPRTPRRWLALSAAIVPILALAGEFVGRWVR